MAVVWLPGPSAMPDPSGQPPRPQFRRALLGYRRGQVDLAVSDMREELGLLKDGLRRSERDLADAWREAAAAAERTEAAVAKLAAATGEVEEARRAVVREGDAIRERAEAEASRLRAMAEAEANAVREDIGRLEAVRAEARRSLREALERAEAEVAPAVDVEDLVRLGKVQLGDLGSRTNGHGRLRIEVGPLSDFDRLTRFQDLTAEVAGEPVEIERFSEGRATLSMAGADVADILRALEERPDLEFSVRTRLADRIVLDLDED